MRVLRAQTALVLLITAGVTLTGAVQKAACANAEWAEQRTGVGFQCYSDIADLYLTEQLAGGRLPLLDPCLPSIAPCDEYPVGTMYVMRATASLAGSGGDPYFRFYWLNAALLLACALLITWTLERMGAKTLWFAAAPVLAIYGTMNWDLVAVAAATLATYLYTRQRDAAAGALLGLGAALKLYPALLLIPLVAARVRDRRLGDAARISAWTAGTWVVVNLPFALLSFPSWIRFFSFSASRSAEYDSAWRVLCYAGVCLPTGVVNVLSLAVPVCLTGLAWKAKARRQPGFPRWTVALPLVAFFLVTNKIWSPQYSLWLLPWLALVPPILPSYFAYQLSEVAVYLARFSFFEGLERSDAEYGLLAVFLVLRTVALLWLVIEWVRHPAPARDAQQPFDECDHREARLVDPA